MNICNLVAYIKGNFKHSKNVLLLLESNTNCETIKLLDIAAGFSDHKDLYSYSKVNTLITFHKEWLLQYLYHRVKQWITTLSHLIF
jgi:hypothetical protein